MEELKKPVGMLSVANSFGLIAVGVYLNNQINAQKLKTEEIEENLSSVITKLKETQNQTAFINSVGEALKKLDKVISDNKNSIVELEEKYEGVDEKLEAIIESMNDNGLEVNIGRKKKKSTKKKSKKRMVESENEESEEEDSEEDIDRQIEALRKKKGKR